MTFYHKKTHRDQIWSKTAKAEDIQKKLCATIADTGFTPVSTSKEWKYCQYNLPVLWERGDQIISWRVGDSLFMADPEAWTRLKPNAIISDNILLKPINGHDLSLYPEHMYIHHSAFTCQDQTPKWGYNCFMNRISGDRSIVFYELIRRNILQHGLVSFNCFMPGDNRYDDLDHTEKNYDWQYESADLGRYNKEHEIGRSLIPYNNIEPAGLELEQCIFDSNVSLSLETYISDDHIVFSEKIFRSMQLPRPWLLYCSPTTIQYLRQQGFDVLDDYVDHEYDLITEHFDRLHKILDQLETFIDRKYSDKDYARFNQAAIHNQNLLLTFEKAWPAKFDSILNQIKLL